jgi:DNA-binding transcriptional regulator YiaG
MGAKTNIDLHIERSGHRFSAGPGSGTRPALDDGNRRLRRASEEGVYADAASSNESFAGHLKALRRQLACKQIALSQAIGCTDSAISLWESGARLPTPRSLSRILAAIAEGGASTADVLTLRGFWRDAYARRSGLGS